MAFEINDTGMDGFTGVTAGAQAEERWQFMTVAAGLEYLYHRTDPRTQASAADDGDDTEHDEDEEELQEAHDLEEAGGEWLVEQGFDPKPSRS